MTKALAGGFIFAALAVPVGLLGESGITRQQADDILNELRQIRQLLAKPAPAINAAPPARPDQPIRVQISVADRPFLGKKDAPITIVEFTDYQCPFCRQFHLNTFSEIRRDYIDSGKVRFYSKDLPLDFHANALGAAQAARCAGEQGEFWRLREIMSTNADQLATANILGWVKDLKLNSGLFQSCVESEKYKSAVQTDIQEARRIGADGTPAFVIGKSTPDGVDGELIIGALPYASFRGKLQALEAAR